jgi:hypothetical protein
VEGIMLTSTALNIIACLNACSAIFYYVLTLQALVIGFPVILLAKAGIFDWFWLKIAIRIAEQAHLWIEAYSAPNDRAVDGCAFYLIIKGLNLMEKSNDKE